MSRTGILGGSFDPVHIGHVELAKTAAADLKLEKLLVIPAFDPPHKNSCIASFEQRYRMLELSFEGIPKVTVSDIEKRLGGKSYTINTIRALKNELGRTDLYLIIGSDQLYTIEQWYMYGSILKETHTVAVTRGNDSYTDMQEFANSVGRIRVLNTDIPDVSSTEIRERIRNGLPGQELLPSPVAEFIGTEGLYRG